MKKESFEERHADNISLLKLVLIVVCLIAIPLTFWINHRDVGSVNKRVTNVESPCVRYGPKSEACKRAFEQAVLTITHPEACAILRKAGLRIQNCAGARLAQEKGRHKERAATRAHNAGGGDATSTPSPGHSQPGPPPSGPPTESPGKGNSGENHPLSPPVSEPAHHGVVESVGPTVGNTISGATETVCSTPAAVHISCP